MTTLRFQTGFPSDIPCRCSRSVADEKESFVTGSERERDIQTHKRFKRTLIFLGQIHNLQIFGVIPFIKLQNNT